jgi:nucleobase:cation symporter-1, NCS1 family
MLGAIALVVSYSSGPMLNFGDFARYGKSFKSVRNGNLLGLPANFLMVSLPVVFSPAFDFSHVSPQRISWRMDGMIAAVGPVLIMP